VLLTSCRPEDRSVPLPDKLGILLENAASGSGSELDQLAETGGEGAWFALAAAAEEAGYHGLARDLQIRSAQEDGYPYGLISLTSALIADPAALRNPLRVLKNAEKHYGPDERLRHARIAVLEAEGKDRALADEMEFYRGESWELPVLSAALRREEMDAELEAVTERLILHTADPEVLLLLPEEAVDALSPEYRHLFAGRTDHSLDDYRAWLTAAAVAEEVCSLESSAPVFAEMADTAREEGREEEWAGVLTDAALKLCGAKRYGASFQAGRLYREKRDWREASEAFRLAAGALPKGLPRDRAVWYQLKTMYQDNTVTTEEELEAFSMVAGSWDDSGRFDGLIEEFLHRRIRRGEWNTLETVYRDWGSAWPAGERSRAAWLLAFAAWEGRLTGGISPGKYLETAFEAAPWSWSGLRAAGILDKELSSLFPEDPAFPSPAEISIGNEAGEEDLIIRLYLKWGLNRLAAETVMENSDLYTAGTIRLTAHALGESDPRLSIRIASQLWGREGFSPSREDLLLRYPLPRVNGVLASEIAREEGLPPEILIGLVRTESAWDSFAVSRSGAEGLAQFMPSTWDEWTRRLRLSEDADPMDPETNLTLAAAYLEWLNLRDWTFGWPDVLVSYNAGGGRLRSWRRERPGLGEDLFGVSIPVEEPRSYISKVLSAGTIYGYLYAGKTPASLHREWDLEMIPIRNE